MNLLIDLSKNDLAYITSLYEEEKLKNEIDSLVQYKYTEDVYNSVINDTVNNFTYIIGKSDLDVYFNNIPGFPNVSISMNPIYHDNDNSKEEKKYIAFTYDDGPSEYTLDILKYLEDSNSSATFFMIGNKMKTNEDIVKLIHNSNSEVGSHGYTHKKLNDISLEELHSELNSTNIIFNEITRENIKLLRPPYGKYNIELLNSSYKIISWNVDTKDWLVKDSDTIVNTVIKNACDGCIVLMHDTYKTTLNATKDLVPILNNFGYEVVSVSKLMEINNDNASAISYIK